MRPIKLTIEGLNSFTDEQVVDFEAAGADNIFCISGVTGSGKSTILDAMILSLYDRHTTRGNLKDYVNLARDCAKISFEFELSGNTYLSAREFYRDRNKKSKFVLRKNGELFLEGDDAYKYIADEIGLTAEEFTNVVVLQQGEFSKFLKSTKGGRIGLVSRLFNLTRLSDLGQAFNAKSAELRSKSEALTKKCEAYEGVTDESVAALSASIEAAKKQLQEAEVSAAKASADALGAAKTSEAYLRDVELKKKIEESEAKLSQLSLRLSKGEEYIAELEKIVPVLDEDEKERFRLVALRARAVEGRARLAEAEKNAAALKESERELDALTARRTAAEEENKRVSSERDALFSSLVARLSGAAGNPAGENSAGENSAAGSRAEAETAATYEDAAARLAALGAELKRFDEEVQKAESEERDAAVLEKSAGHEHDVALAEFAAMNARHSELMVRAEEVTAAAAKAKRDYEKAAEENALALVTAGLKEGDTCPVCGGKITVLHRGHGADTAALKAERDRLEAEERETTKSLMSSKETVSAINEKVQATEKAALAAAAVHERKAAALGALDRVRAAGRRAIYTEASALMARLTEVKKSAEEAARLLAELDARAGMKRSAVEQMRASTEKELAAAKEAAASGSPEEIDGRLKAIADKKRIYDENRKKAEGTISALRAEAEGLKGAIGTYRASLTGAACVTKEDVAAAEEKAKILDAARLDLVRSVESLETTLKRANEDLGSKKACESERAAIDKERSDYEELARLFGKNAFTEFVAAEYIKEFTAAASKKLSFLTGGKYSLKYDEPSGEFFVSDFLAGGQPRSVGTLSGGEIFLASLSLAIAISEQISRDRGLDFFFVDEGFGTLSPDALDTVTEALEVLARATLVGVITHRGELIERISSVIRVEPADETHGSRVTLGGRG